MLAEMFLQTALGAMLQFDMPGKFYKGECQEKYSSLGRMFSCFPARMTEQDLF
jgi:hypothetical protein